MTDQKSLHVHYGCGLDAPKEWDNFDISPTLRAQKIPIIGKLLTRSFHNVAFPENVRYGNIVKNLPGVDDNSCTAVYCSHTLEHLSLQDFRKALKNTYRILAPSGVFRCVVPDLEHAAREYVNALDNSDANASHEFLKTTMLGKSNRPKGLKAILQLLLGNSSHLWMWDHHSLAKELKDAGFRDVRPAKFNDSAHSAFVNVENEDRFQYAVAIEAIK